MTQQTINIITIIIATLDVGLVGYITYKLIRKGKAKSQPLACETPVIKSDLESEEEKNSQLETKEEVTLPSVSPTETKEETPLTNSETKTTLAVSYAIELERDDKGRKFSLVRYRKSFVAKLVLGRDLIPLYLELYNEILSYKDVKEKTSFKCSRFYKGRKTLFRIFARGKRLYLYLPLDSNQQDPKYFLVDVSSKKIGEELPSLLKVLSPRSLKYAKELIAQVMENEGFEKNPEYVYDASPEARFYPRSFQTLLGEREIIEYRVTRYVDETFDVAAYNPELEDEDDEDNEAVVDDTKVSLDEVNLFMSDAEIAPYLGKSSHTGKQDIVNLDELEKHFDENATIDIAELKRLKLISNRAQRVKVLARGGLEKTFHVEADDFSKEALKLILFNKGTIKYRD